MTTKQTLQKAWGEYLRLQTESYRRDAESYRIIVESRKLLAEGEKLSREGLESFCKAEAFWEKAVKAVYGDMTYGMVWNTKWQSYECRLANGEVYRSPEGGN